MPDSYPDRGGANRLRYRLGCGTAPSRRRWETPDRALGDIFSVIAEKMSPKAATGWRAQPRRLTSRTAPLSALVAMAAYARSDWETLRSRFFGA